MRTQKDTSCKEAVDSRSRVVSGMKYALRLAQQNGETLEDKGENHEDNLIADVRSLTAIMG